MALVDVKVSTEVDKVGLGVAQVLIVADNSAEIIAETIKEVFVVIVIITLQDQEVDEEPIGRIHEDLKEDLEQVQMFVKRPHQS